MTGPRVSGPLEPPASSPIAVARRLEAAGPIPLARPDGASSFSGGCRFSRQPLARFARAGEDASGSKGIEARSRRRGRIRFGNQVNRNGLLLPRGRKRARRPGRKILPWRRAVE